MNSQNQSHSHCGPMSRPRRDSQDGHEIVLPLVRDDRLAQDVAWVPAAHVSVTALPAMFGPITLEAVK